MCHKILSESWQFPLRSTYNINIADISTITWEYDENYRIVVGRDRLVAHLLKTCSDSSELSHMTCNMCQVLTCNI